MSRRTGLITFIVFILFVAVGVVAVLALGTKTGLALGGPGTATGATSKANPLYVQEGWVRNNSPWPVEITGVAVNDTDTASAPKVFLSARISEEEVKKGKKPTWAKEAASFPYTLAGGELRYFGFSMVAGKGKVASFDTVTVSFSGPLGFTFDSTYNGVAVAASSSDLPNALVSTDPTDDSDSLDSYIALLRSALKSGRVEQIRTVMGDDATEKQAIALRKSQKGYATALLVDATRIDDNPKNQTLVFYKTKVSKGLSPITVEWRDFRWRVTAWK